MLRFVEHGDFNAALARPHVTPAFVSELIALFDSDDPRERDMLKTLTHRLYGKLVNARPLMRRTINNRFLRFVYEDDRCIINGVAELLEILGSIINGFASPIKDEHTAFLFRVLVPLHRARHVSAYHPQYE
jgi:serine/threonine-protein phosphatase 2A regulatory subunit B'